MEAAHNHFESLLSQAGDYAETRVRLLKLKVADQTSETVSTAASALIVWIFVLFFTVILSIGIALLVGDWLGKTYYGFFAVAAVYGIAGFICHVNRKRLIKTPVSNFIIEKILKPAE